VADCDARGAPVIDSWTNVPVAGWKSSAVVTSPCAFLPPLCDSQAEKMSLTDWSSSTSDPYGLTRNPVLQNYSTMARQ
jgi:hypothetical protein